jgi:hypothetical protein
MGPAPPGEPAEELRRVVVDACGEELGRLALPLWSVWWQQDRVLGCSAGYDPARGRETLSPSPSIVSPMSLSSGEWLARSVTGMRTTPEGSRHRIVRRTRGPRAKHGVSCPHRASSKAVAFPTKGSRVIVVDGVRYRYIGLFSERDRMPDECHALRVQLASEPRPVLRAEVGYAEMKPAYVVRQAIHIGLRDGWRPSEPGREHDLGNLDARVDGSALRPTDPSP